MITITTDIPPFKKRAGLAIKVFVTMLFIGLVARIVEEIFSGRLTATQKSNDEAAIIVVIAGVVAFCLLGFISQIWVLDSVSVDENTRKIIVRIRRFDKVVIKGEYHIDDKLILRIDRKTLRTGEAYRLLIKYGSKRVWSESISPASHFSGWDDYKFYNIINAVKALR